MNELVYRYMNHYLNKYATYDPGPDADMFARKSTQGRLNTEIEQNAQKSKKLAPAVGAGLATGLAIKALGDKYGGGGKMTNTLAGLGGIYAANKVNKYRNKETK